MFPWMMGMPGMGGPASALSLYQMYAQNPPQGGFFSGGAQSPYGNMFQPGYWDRVNASRQPGEANSNVFFRGLLPQSMWPQEWRDPKYGQAGDRSDQQGNRNQPDRGNVMGPPQGAPGGPDNKAQSGYDTNTVSPGYDPGWMKWFGGAAPAKRNAKAALTMGGFGLSMLQPRPPTHTGPYPWI